MFTWFFTQWKSFGAPQLWGDSESMRASMKRTIESPKCSPRPPSSEMINPTALCSWTVWTVGTELRSNCNSVPKFLKPACNYHLKIISLFWIPFVLDGTPTEIRGCWATPQPVWLAWHSPSDPPVNRMNNASVHRNCQTVEWRSTTDCIVEVDEGVQWGHAKSCWNGNVPWHQSCRVST